MKFKINTRVYLSVAALLLSLAVSGVILAAVGYSPFSAYSSMLIGSLGGVDRISDTLGTATPLMFTALAVLVAAKGGAINIGCEGQLYVGALSAALVGAYVELPMLIHIPLCLFAAALAGAVWASIAAYLKIKLGISEVIITIMLNYIAIYLTDYLTTYRFKAEGMVVKTPTIMPTAKLMKLYPYSRLTIALLLALLLAALIGWMLKKTVFGYELKALGLNPLAAETGGIDIKKTFMAAMFISGALAGLSGAAEVLGVHNYFIKGFSPGYGFDGLSIAVLGQFTPLGTVLSAFLYGALRSGAAMMDRMTKIPGDFVVIMQALVIIFVATPQLARSLNPLEMLKKKREGKDAPPPSDGSPASDNELLAEGE